MMESTTKLMKHRRRQSDRFLPARFLVLAASNCVAIASRSLALWMRTLEAKPSRPRSLRHSDPDRGMGDRRGMGGVVSQVSLMNDQSLEPTAQESRNGFRVRGRRRTGVKTWFDEMDIPSALVRPEPGENDPWVRDND